MKLVKFIFLLLLLPTVVWGQDVGFYVRTDCAELDAVNNETLCLQSTTTGGRTAGTVYVYTASVWTSVSSVGTGDLTEVQGTANQITITNGEGPVPVVALADPFRIIGHTATAPVSAGTAPPGSCNVGDLFFDTNAVAGSNLYGCTASNTWTLEGGVTTAASSVTFTPAGSIAANDVQEAIEELDAEKQPLDADLTAIAALATTGCLSRTAANTYILRTNTGTSGKISITNGDCVSGNPTYTLGTDAVQITQTNVFGAFLQNFGAASVRLPTSAGAAPTTDGDIAYDTTADKLKYGNSGATKTIAVEDGNIATASALAANPAGCVLANGQWTNDIDAAGTSNCAVVISSGAAEPSAGTVRYPGEIYVDTRAFDASTGAGRTWKGKAAGGNFAAVAEELDGWTTITDGVNSMSPSGSDTGTVRATDGLRASVFNYTGTAFTNQPTNDGVEFISDNAGDTTQFIRICGTTSGGHERDATCETNALNGTSQVSTTKTNWNNILLAEICTTSACIANTISAGTVTVREASGNATIVTIPNKTTYRASQDLLLIQYAATVTKSAMAWAGSLFGDGTQCPADPTTVTINSGAPRATFICADNDASTLYGEFAMPDGWNGGTVTLQGFFVQTAADTNAVNADVAMACRSNTTAINNTWGTEIAMDVTMTGSNALNTVTTAAITPNGTCTGTGRLLQFRWQIDAAGTTTAVATLHMLGFKLEYGVSGAGSDG